MQLAFVVLNRDEVLEDLLTGFLELGISGATVLDTVGMGRILQQDVPIFAGLNRLMGRTRPTNKTIFTVVQDETMPELIKLVESVCGSFDEPGSGIIFSVPVSMVKGMSPELTLDW